MTSYKVSRRAFLRGCGASTLMLPLLRNIEARAQGKPAPLRFLVIHHSLGTQLGPPIGRRVRPVAATGAGDHDQLRAAGEQRTVHAAAAEDGDDRRRQHRLRQQVVRPGRHQHPRGRDGRDHDRPAEPGAGAQQPGRLRRRWSVDRSDSSGAVAGAGRTDVADAHAVPVVAAGSRRPLRSRRGRAAHAVVRPAEHGRRRHRLAAQARWRPRPRRC